MDSARVKVLKFICMLAVGGTERQFVYATKALHEAGLDMHAAVMKRKGPFVDDIQALGIPLDEYNTPSLHSVETLRQQWRLSRDIRARNIEVVHAYGFYGTVFAIPAAKLAGCPVTLAAVRDTGVYLTPWMRRFQKAACHLADGVIANSNAVRDWLINDGVNAKHIHVIRNGIAIPPKRDHASNFRVRQELGIELDAPVVATVCRLTPSKGLDDLLQSAVRVRACLPRVRFLIAGTDLSRPGYKIELEQYAAGLKLGENVRFLGERADVLDILSESDLFVLPSLSEGLSNVLLEAMTASLPIVATDVGGNSEVVEQGKTGLLIPPRNVDELTAAMVQILQCPDMAHRFGDAGRARVVSEFSLEKMLRQTYDLYFSLLEKRNPSRRRMSQFLEQGTE
jgi:glycosyltransferase involved in cell wall biosynthesis